jgi:hypothetical protein
MCYDYDPDTPLLLLNVCNVSYVSLYRPLLVDRHVASLMDGSFLKPAVC